MAFTIRVAKGDPKCGEYGPGGAIQKWPEVDCDDRPYNHEQGIKLSSVDNTLFVVVPTGFRGEVLFAHETPKSGQGEQAKRSEAKG